MRNVHFSCLKQWIDTKLKDLAKKSPVICLDNLKCDICKSKLVNKHYNEDNAQNYKLIDIESIDTFQDKCVVHL